MIDKEVKESWIPPDSRFPHPETMNLKHARTYWANDPKIIEAKRQAEKVSWPKDFPREYR